MKDILGLRASTDNAGALTEIGWTDVETKATKARLLFWWRLGRTDSALMRKLEQQAHLQQTQEAKNDRPSAYNWWRVTDSLVQRVANPAQTTPEMLRTMNKNRFRRAIGVALWKEEHGRRLNTCKASRRLQIIAGELTEMAEEDNRKHIQRQSWPGAP